MTNTPPTVTITADKDGLTGGTQINIHDGTWGYRLAGPKYNGSSQNLVTAELNQRDADEIRSYLDRAFPPVTHELTGDVGLTESERTVLRHALDLVAVEMETHPDDYTDAEVEAHTALCRLADPDETPEADRG